MSRVRPSRFDMPDERTTSDRIPAPLEKRRNIFLSYGHHDQHSGLAEQVYADLCERGHEVWFDATLRDRTGQDWEQVIEQGLEQTAAEPGKGRFVLLMTPH